MLMSAHVQAELEDFVQTYLAKSDAELSREISQLDAADDGRLIDFLLHLLLARRSSTKS
jgi:hypothetical protein